MSGLEQKPSGQWVELGYYQSFSAVTPNRFAVRISGLVTIVKCIAPAFRHTRNHFRITRTAQPVTNLFEQGETMEYIHRLYYSAELKDLLDRAARTPVRPERISLAR